MAARRCRAGRLLALTPLLLALLAPQPHAAHALRNRQRADATAHVSSSEAHERLGTVASRAYANFRNKKAAADLIHHLKGSAIFDALKEVPTSNPRYLGDPISRGVAIDTANADVWANFVLNTLLSNASDVFNGACGSLRKPPPRKRGGIAVVTYGLGGMDEEWEAIPAAINALYAALHGYEFIRLTPSCDAGYAASTTLALQAMAQRHGRSLPLEITTKDAALGFLWDVANERRHKAWTALLGIRLALEHFEYVFFLSRASYVAQLASPIEPLFKHLGVGKLVLVPESVLRFDPRAHISTDKQFVMQKLRWSKKHNRGLLGIRAADGKPAKRVGGSAMLFRSSGVTQELIDAWWDAPLEPDALFNVEGRWSDMATKFASLQAVKVKPQKEQPYGGTFKSQYAYDKREQEEGGRDRPRCDPVLLNSDPFHEGCLAAVLMHARYSGRAVLLDDPQGAGLFGGERGLFVRRCAADPAIKVHPSPPPLPTDPDEGRWWKNISPPPPPPLGVDGVEMDRAFSPPPPPEGDGNDPGCLHRRGGCRNQFKPPPPPPLPAPPHPPQAPTQARRRRRKERLHRLGYNTSFGDEAPPPPAPPPAAPPPQAPPPRATASFTDTDKRLVVQQMQAREILNHAFFCTLKNFVRPPAFVQTCYYDPSMRELPAVYGRRAA